MGMEISGKIHVMFEAKQITERFRKREFVLELSENSRYPQSVLFQLTGDRCENLDAFEVGDEVRGPGVKSSRNETTQLRTEQGGSPRAISREIDWPERQVRDWASLIGPKLNWSEGEIRDWLGKRR